MIKINETNVTIMVKDMDQSIDFYKSIGFDLQNRWENHYAMLGSTGITIGLHPGREGAVPEDSNISIGLMIDNAEEAKELLGANKIPYKLEDGKSGIYLHFRDPDGTLIYFTVPLWTR
jgi:catechol 2,3-dioxygenase-like lactoylglutathione lyase family enzyme